MSGLSVVILDRDGTIFEDTYYPRNPDEMKLSPTAGEALRMMQEKGYPLYVVSNQSGVGRGLISDAEFEAVHKRCLELLAKEGVTVAQFGYCFHLPEDGCGCRKPQEGLVPKIHEGKSVDWATSFMVGDKECDVELADKIGAKGFLVLTGHGQKTREAFENAGTLSRYHVCETLMDMAVALPKGNGA